MNLMSMTTPSEESTVTFVKLMATYLVKVVRPVQLMNRPTRILPMNLLKRIPPMNLKK